jgi:hypothetical protein
MRGDVVEVTIMLGDTIVTTGHADGPFAFDWAPDRMLVPPAERDVPVRTRIGLAEVTLVRTAAPERTLPYTSDFDGRAWRYLVISLAVHLLMWGASTTRPPIESRDIEVCGREPPTYAVTFAAPHDEVDGDDLGAAGGGVVPMRLDAPAPRDRVVVDEVVPEPSTASILAALTSDKIYYSSAHGDESFGPLFGPGAEATSGFGTERSSFTTGGCTEEPCGTVGAIGAHRIDGGARTGEGYGMRPHRTTGPICTLTLPVAISGDLDREIIRRHIQRRLDHLTYCYEAQLLYRPEAAGDVALSFVIEPNGHVTGVVASGISTEIETCVAGVIRSIEFPRSAGGGSTQVSYPLTFRVAH